jgi:hypothetical protein
VNSPSEHQATIEGQVVAKSNREFTDDQDEGEIKEQIEPGGGALLARIGLAVLEPGGRISSDQVITSRPDPHWTRRV